MCAMSHYYDYKSRGMQGSQHCTHPLRSISHPNTCVSQPTSMSGRGTTGHEWAYRRAVYLGLVLGLGLWNESNLSCLIRLYFENIYESCRIFFKPFFSITGPKKLMLTTVTKVNLWTICDRRLPIHHHWSQNMKILLKIPRVKIINKSSINRIYRIKCE